MISSPTLKKILLLVLLSAVLLVLNELAPKYTEHDTLLYSEDFETMSLGETWFDQKLRVISATEPGTYDHIIEHSYIPSSSGTPYVGRRFNLSHPVSEATLTFDMKLDKDFEFIKGGKMHGLAGGTATTGCRPVDANGWSVRMMWRETGRPVLYIYHQDRKARCGDDTPVFSNFNFKPETWYKISLYVKLNSAIGSRDGIVSLYIDETKQAEANGLNLTGNLNKKIEYFLYSSFYGGNDPSWSPSKTTIAFYDNFEVNEGLHP